MGSALVKGYCAEDMDTMLAVNIVLCEATMKHTVSVRIRQPKVEIIIIEDTVPLKKFLDVRLIYLFCFTKGQEFM